MVREHSQLPAMPDSPSKSLMAKAQGRQYLRRLFLQGTCIGICAVFLVHSLRFFLLSRAAAGPPRNETEAVANRQQGMSKPKLLAFVGVQSGFSRPHATAQYRYELRREVLRKTWFPSSKAELDRLELEHGIRIRFVIGHSADATAEFNVDVEQRRHRDILRLNIEEDYLSLPNKIVTFFRCVSGHYDAQYILKIDDDVYFRLDRLPHAIPQWQKKEADYVGCMKRGEVFTKPGMRWREPQYPILGDTYYTHVWGSAYCLSGRVASFLNSIPEGSLRFLNNEDTTIGSWMLAFNVTYFDDRRFCSTDCSTSALVVYDYPHCAGLCNPAQQLQELHKKTACHEHPDRIDLLDEIVRVNTVRSRPLPPKTYFEGRAV